MAEEQAAPQEKSPIQRPAVQDLAAESRSLRAVVIGTSIIMWILAVFIIHTLYGMTNQLEQLNATVNDLATVVSSHGLGSYQVVDPSGKVVYKFEAVPAPMPESMPEGGSPMKPNP